MVTELLWVRSNEGFKRTAKEIKKIPKQSFFLWICIFLHNKQMDKPTTKLFSSLTDNYVKIALILVFSLCVREKEGERNWLFMIMEQNVTDLWLAVVAGNNYSL